MKEISIENYMETLQTCFVSLPYNSTSYFKTVIVVLSNISDYEVELISFTTCQSLDGALVKCVLRISYYHEALNESRLLGNVDVNFVSDDSWYGNTTVFIDSWEVL